MSSHAASDAPTGPPNPRLARLAERAAAALMQPDDDLGHAILVALGAAARDPGFLSAAQRRSRPDGYARHLLHADPAGRFAIVSIVWRPGQHTPIHGHHTWCGYVVVAGSLHEESFVRMEAMNAVRRCGAGAERSPGHLCFARAEIAEAHRLGNHGRDEAVSVHVYGVEGARVATHVNRVVALAASEPRGQTGRPSAWPRRRA